MTDPQKTIDPLLGPSAVPPPPRVDTDGGSPTQVWPPQGSAATAVAEARPAAGRRSNVRWLLALIAVLVVAVGTYLIVSLAGVRPAAAPAIGYMPTTTFSYSEARLDLPGDQRQKLAAFLANFPGFKDQSQVDVKLADVLDRIVRAASDGKQTWSNDIQPWFGGQLAVGAGLPAADGLPGASGAPRPAALALAGAGSPLVVVSITDRTKAIDWLVRTTGAGSLSRTTYKSADLFVGADDHAVVAVAVTDGAMLAGSQEAVKAAVDTNGAGTFAETGDMKAALATLDKDYVAFGVVRTQAYLQAIAGLLGSAQPGTLEGSQLDETATAMIPAWQASTVRFENDAIVAAMVGPSWAIGYDSANRTSELIGHVPATSLAYFEAHDVGPALKAVLDKFRALPETKPQFDTFDRALSFLGGYEAVLGWWGDAAVVVAPNGDGTIGGGLVIKPRDPAAAERLLTTLGGFIALGGGQVGVSARTEDHNGTKITILDVSGVGGLSQDQLPPGYKPELAWATTANVTVVGFGRDFVAAVLDAGPGTALGDDARFKALVSRVGAENISIGFVDISGIRTLLEPLMQRTLSEPEWANYTTEIRPYLEPLDAIVQAVRKDGGLDRGGAAITVR